MKKLTRLAAVLLASVMTLGGIVACDNGNGDDPKKTEKPKTEQNDKTEQPKSTEKEASESDETEPPETTKPEESQTTEAPAPTESVQIKYHTIGTSPDDLEMVVNEMNKYSGEKIGVTIDLTFHGWGDYGSNLNTMINSGEAWDLAFGSAINGYMQCAQRGLFADVKPMLDSVPELNEFIPEVLWKGVTTSDGRIFGVPAYKDSAATQYWVYDEDYIEEYDIDIENIISLGDLTPVLERIKADKPDSYPMLLDRNGINSLNFEYEDMGSGAAVKFGETTVVNMYDQPDIREKYEILQDWYKKGYINPDANVIDEFEGGTNPIASAQGFVGADRIWSHNRKDGPVKSHPRLGPMYTSSSIQGSFVVISANSELQEQALKFVELVNLDPAFRNLYAYGVEGTHYEKVEENVIKRLDASERYAVPAYSQGTFVTLYVEEGEDPEKWIKVAEQNEEAEASPLLGFVFDNSSVQSELAALDNVVKKYKDTLNTGAAEGDVNELIDQMVKEQEQIGIQKVMDEMQSQIDAFLAN